MAIFAQNIRIYRNDVETVNEFLNKGFLNSTRFWMYIVPGLLICLFTLIICLIGIKTRIHLVKDYKAMLEKMYDIYREKNPETSDVEWTNHLEKLDSELAEREKAKKEKEAKK